MDSASTSPTNAITDVPYESPRTQEKVAVPPPARDNTAPPARGGRLGPIHSLGISGSTESQPNSMQQTDPAPRPPAVVRPPLPSMPSGLGLPDATPQPVTELTSRNRGQANPFGVPGHRGPPTDNLVSADEAAWQRLHVKARVHMQEAGINMDNDIKPMYKLTRGKLVKNTSSPVVIKFNSEVYGIDRSSGEIVPWAMNTRMIPLHMACVFVLAESIVPGLRFSDLYSMYFNSVDAVNEVISDDDPEYSESVKRLLNVHSEGASAHVWHFFNCFRNDSKNRKGAKDKLREWVGVLKRAIRIREMQIAADQERRRLVAGEQETVQENAQIETEDRGGLEGAEMSDDED